QASVMASANVRRIQREHGLINRIRRDPRRPWRVLFDVSAKLLIVRALKNLVRQFKREIAVYRRVLSDRRTPMVAKVLLFLAVAYLAMPFDLIPDFIPVLGQLDDLVIVPGLVFLATRFIPSWLVAEHRMAVVAEMDVEE